MTRYELSEYRKLPWARFMRWFRVGLATFAVILLADSAYGFYHQFTAGTDLLHNVGAGLIFFILAMFLAVAILMRSGADAMTIDETGVRLEYQRGAPVVRSWGSSRPKLRGRRTDGAKDSISRGKPLWSVYGPQGGLSETFIPESAYRELVQTAQRHGLQFTERAGRPDWFLYTIG